MKINYTMFGTTLTGGVRVLLEIVNCLIERGHRVTITTMGSPIDTKWFPLKAEIKYIGGTSFLERVLRFGIRKIFNVDPFYPRRYIKKLAKSIPECDINVATFCLTAFSVFRSEKGVPFYHMQHYEPLIFDNPYLSKLAKETYYLSLNKIANCTWLKRKLEEEGIPNASNIPVINPAIDHKIFHCSYKRNDIKKKKIKIVALGKTVRWKGLLDLLQAMEIVFKKRKDIELVLFGCKTIPYKNFQIPYKCVSILVNEELAQLYSSADVVVCPSWYESFPLPPLEAMACGTPVITTMYGTEDYAFDGENALVVPPKDPKAIAEAILRILEDKKLADKLRESGLKTVKQFTWDKTTDKIEKLFLSKLK